MPYYVYIMASASRVLYTGVTNNIERRAIDHRQGQVSSFSARYKTRELVFVEVFGDIRAAIKREKQLKGWLRARKIALIESRNPHWKDLTAEWHEAAGHRSSAEHTATCHSEGRCGKSDKLSPPEKRRPEESL